MTKIKTIIKSNIEASFGVTNELSKSRIKICEGCDRSSNVFYFHCRECKCRLSAKTLVKEEICPLKKW